MDLLVTPPQPKPMEYELFVTTRKYFTYYLFQTETHLFV